MELGIGLRNPFFHRLYKIKFKNYVRPFHIFSQRFCKEKSIYQHEEEGPKPRFVHGEEYPEWRKQWIKRDGEWKSKLSLFTQKNPSPEIMNALQKLPHLDYGQIKEWWVNMKQVQEIQNQKYLPERIATLGVNLAAIHFLIYRHCSVRLKDSSHWMTGLQENLELPTTYQDGYFVEAIDCSNFHHNGIRYEGIENFSGLNFLKWLSLKNNKHVDVWCLDRLAGQNGKSLEYLDITGCQLSPGCVTAISRMTKLKVLVVTDPGDNMEMQAALSMLEQERPELIIQTTENTEQK